MLLFWTNCYSLKNKISIIIGITLNLQIILKSLQCWVFSFMNMLHIYISLLIRKMQELDPGLIAVGAKRYTTTSVLVCSVISAVVLFVILFFCPTYMKIAFFVGAALCLVMLLGKLTPDNKNMFENFCAGYCRFVPDDELRTLMYNKEIKKIDRRLRELGYDRSFVPKFKDKA